MIVLLNTSFCVLTMPIVILQIIHVNVRDQMSDEILIFDYNMTNSMNIHSKISKEKNLDLIKSIFENSFGSLQSLILPSVPLTDESLKQICSMLNGDGECNLKTLDLSWNNLLAH